LADHQVLGGVSLGRLYPDHPKLHNAMLVTATETTTDEDIRALGSLLDALLVDSHEGSPT
jgi:glycine dehydrogenase subunit 1